MKGSTTKRGETPEEKRIQVDPPHGRPDARVHGRAALTESVVGPASEVHGRPGIASLHPAPDRALRRRLNGFARMFAEVLRHRVGGGRRRVPYTAATGLSDALKAGKPSRRDWDRFIRSQRAGKIGPSGRPVRPNH